LKSLLQRDQRFTLAAANGTGYTVHLVSLTAAGSHKFQAISLHVTFRFMVKMKNVFESRPWPSTKNRCKIDRETIRTSVGENLSEMLFKLKLGNFVKITEGAKLAWRYENISSAVARMPAHLEGSGPPLDSAPAVSSATTASAEHKPKPAAVPKLELACTDWRLPDTRATVHYVQTEASLDAAITKHPELRGLPTIEGSAGRD
jgi:hypothetical protein